MERHLKRKQTVKPLRRYYTLVLLLLFAAAFLIKSTKFKRAYSFFGCFLFWCEHAKRMILIHTSMYYYCLLWHSCVTCRPASGVEFCALIALRRHFASALCAWGSVLCTGELWEGAVAARKQQRIIPEEKLCCHSVLLLMCCYIILPRYTRVVYSWHHNSILLYFSSVLLFKLPVSCVSTFQDVSKEMNKYTSGYHYIKFTNPLILITAKNPTDPMSQIPLSDA
eukprot:gene8234-5755_t